MLRDHAQPKALRRSDALCQRGPSALHRRRGARPDLPLGLQRPVQPVPHALLRPGGGHVLPCEPAPLMSTALARLWTRGISE